MTVSDLLLIGPDGSIVDGGRPERRIYNQAAFAIHHAIHTARPDIDAACHSHSMYGKAFSTLGRNSKCFTSSFRALCKSMREEREADVYIVSIFAVEITTQDSCAFYNQCALYENFGGVVLADEEGNNIAKALGDKNRALVLQNHGILSAGTSIEAAVGYL